jgi:hypothetical protein
VGPSPIGVTLLVLADQDAEPDTRPPVALIAQLMKPDHFCFNRALRSRSRRNSRNSRYDSDREAGSRQE